MDLQPYVEAVRQELRVAAAAAGDGARELADRLSAPLESALRLALLEALSAAAEEITGELAPRSVEVRLRGRDPEFVVSAPLEDEPVGNAGSPDADSSVFFVQHDDDGDPWRVTLRLPEGLRSHVEGAARREGASLNSWLVRAAAAAVQGAVEGASQGVSHVAGQDRSTRPTGRRVTGWVR
jgi:hypothetical protein